jgi:hypothetical protein
MDRKLSILKLYLDELGIEFNIASVDSRKTIQKAVYIGQLSGADLGYRYGWYKMGPYCARLAEDYYRLSTELSAAEPALTGTERLAPAVRERLTAVVRLMSPPSEDETSKEDWLETIASLHFLTRVRGKSSQEALEELQAQKPHLMPVSGSAMNQLAKLDFKQNGLLQSAPS